VFRSAIAGASLYLIINGFYAYTFFWGGYLRYNKVMQGDREYSGGSVIAIMFCVIIGCFQLGGIGTHIKLIAEGKVAGKLAFEVMDHVPGIVIDKKDSKQVVRDQIKGRIEFKNVNFTYPSRQELKVLKNFSCVFEEGKTTALVGPSGSGKSTII